MKTDESSTINNQVLENWRVCREPLPRKFETKTYMPQNVLEWASRGTKRRGGNSLEDEDVKKTTIRQVSTFIVMFNLRVRGGKSDGISGYFRSSPK